MKEFWTIVKKIWPVAILGLVIRLILMPITMHSDIWATSFAQYLFSFKGVFNVYDYLANLPKTSSLIQNYGSNFFTYPPLAYFSLGIFGFLLKSFFNHDFFNNLAMILPDVLNDQRLYGHLFLTKLPYLFFDFGSLYFLAKILDSERQKKTAILLWLFNPLSLYTTYMIGQFDIVPVFFTILALYLAKEKKLGWSVFALGVGGAYKMFPLFFLPFLVLGADGNVYKKIKLLIIGTAPFLLTILPFINSSVFRQTVLFSNQSQKMLFAKIAVSGAEYLSVFVVLYIFLLSFASIRRLDSWKSFLAVMLLFFSVTHYHPQWFLWLSPFLLMLMVKDKKHIFVSVVLFVCWFVIMMFFEPSLSISLFAPISKSLSSVVPLSDFVGRYYDVFQLKSLVRSVFSGISLAIIVSLQKDEKAV